MRVVQFLTPYGERKMLTCKCGKPLDDCLYCEPCKSYMTMQVCHQLDDRLTNLEQRLSNHEAALEVAKILATEPSPELEKARKDIAALRDLLRVENEQSASLAAKLDAVTKERDGLQRRLSEEKEARDAALQHVGLLNKQIRRVIPSVAAEMEMLGVNIECVEAKE